MNSEETPGAARNTNDEQLPAPIQAMQHRPWFEWTVEQRMAFHTYTASLPDSPALD